MNQLTRFNPLEFNKAIIGFDRLFNDIERRYANSVQSNYPPFNIFKTSEDSYVIELAVTGFKKEEILIEIDHNQLMIKGEKTKTSEEVVEPDIEYIHRGLATRDFERRFDLAEHMIIERAVIEDGMLSIFINRVLPDELKRRRIEIEM